MNIDVLHEDNHLIVINKPAGMLVQGDITGDIPLSEHVKQYLKEKYDKPGDVYLGVVHRLDRPVSGVLLFARTSKALTRMNDLFKNKEVEKTYFALTARAPQSPLGRLVHYLRRDKQKNISTAFPKELPETKKAILSYRLAGKIGKYHLLEIDLETGRHHQIRVQLAASGCPVEGDVKYGAAQGFGRHIYLHAYKIKFVHPVKKEPVEIKAPLPNDPVWNNFKKLIGW